MKIKIEIYNFTGVQQRKDKNAINLQNNLLNNVIVVIQENAGEK